MSSRKKNRSPEPAFSLSLNDQVLSGKRWFEQEAEASANQLRTPTRRMSIFDVFRLRRQDLSSASRSEKRGIGKESGSSKRRSDFLKRSMTSIVGVGEDDPHSADVPDQDGDLFRTPNPAPDRLHPRIPAKKAKRLLGIETPPSQTCEQRLRPRASCSGIETLSARRDFAESLGSADRSMSTNTIEIAPLANCNELNEKYNESVQQIPTRSLPTPPFQSPNQDDSESGSSFITAIGTPAFTRSENESSCRIGGFRSILRSAGSFNQHENFLELSADQMQSPAATNKNDGESPRKSLGGRALGSKKRVVDRERRQSRITKVASVIMKGFGNGSRAAKLTPTRQSKRLSAQFELKQQQQHCISTGKAECVEKRTVLEEQHLQKTNDRVNEFKRVVNILNEDLDFESAQEAMYDAIACDISMTGKPLSRWCEFVLEHMSAEMHEEINVALRHMKKFFILNSDENFKACKYLLFVVVDDHLNNNDVKTWQEMRFAYCNLISEALKHKHIDKLLLPYLFTADQRLTQSEIAHTALTSVFFIFLQSGFSEIKQIHIGGVCSNESYHMYYANELETIVRNMLHADDENCNPVVVNT